MIWGSNSGIDKSFPLLQKTKTDSLDQRDSSPMTSKFYPRCKKGGSEFNLSPLSNFEFKNGWRHSSFPPTHFQDVNMDFTFPRTHFYVPSRVSYSNDKDCDDDDDNDEDILLFYVFVCFVSFYVLFVCKCVLYNCHRVATHFQVTNIKNISNYRKMKGSSERSDAVVN